MPTEYEKKAKGGDVRIYTGIPHVADGKNLSFRIGTEEVLRIEPDGGIFFRRERIGSDLGVSSCMWSFFCRLGGNTQHNVAFATGVGYGDGPNGALLFFIGEAKDAIQVLRIDHDRKAFVRGVETHDPETIIGALRMFLVGVLSMILRLESEGKSWLPMQPVAGAPIAAEIAPEEAPPAPPEGVPEP